MILRKLKNKEVISGFGHRLNHYKNKVESRVQIAERVARPLAEKKGMGHYCEIYDIISKIMLREKDRTPNADLPISLLYKVIGIPKELNTPIFQGTRPSISDRVATFRKSLQPGQYNPCPQSYHVQRRHRGPWTDRHRQSRTVFHIFIAR